MMRTMTILGAGLIGLMHPTASHAGPLDFTFSFTGTAPPGNVLGTVTGEIFGLTDNTANQAATNVVVDSAPAALGLPASPPPLTIFTDDNPNSFTVMNGEITDAAFQAIDSSFTFILEINARGVGENALTNDGQLLLNEAGFPGVTFTPVQTIPEPSSVTLLGTGLGFTALWLLRRRLRRRAASA